MIASSARKAKLIVINSATGRSPAIAAPTAAPAITISLIGVSITLRSPNSWKKPRVTLCVPSQRPTSSPMMKTRSSRIISSCSAARSASRIDITFSDIKGSSLSLRLIGVHVADQVFVSWYRAGVGVGDRVRYGFFSLLFSLSQLRLNVGESVAEHRAHPHDWVAGKLLVHFLDTLRINFIGHSM